MFWDYDPLLRIFFSLLFSMPLLIILLFSVPLSSVPLFMFHSSFCVPFLLSVFLIFSVPGFPGSAYPRLLPKEMAKHLSPTQESPPPLHILIPVIRI